MNLDFPKATDLQEISSYLIICYYTHAHLVSSIYNKCMIYFLVPIIVVCQLRNKWKVIFINRLLFKKTVNVLCRVYAEPFVLAESRTPMHSVHHNPVDSRLLASANSKDGIALWDIRVPKQYVLCCFI